MVRQLCNIEENYQKYAFYYTKYLEEKVVQGETIRQAAKEHTLIIDNVKDLVMVLKDTMTMLI